MLQAATLAAAPGLAAGSRGPALSATNTAASWTTDANSDHRAGPAPDAATPLGRHIWSEAERLDFAVHGSPDDDLAGPETPPRAAPLAAHGSTRDPATSDLPPPAPRVATARRAFFRSQMIAQMGVEIMGLTIQPLANQLSANFAQSSLLPTFSFTALALGSLAAGPAVDRLGIRGIYLATLLASAAAGSALVAKHISVALALPGLIVLFGTDYFFLGARRIAEAIAPTELYKGDPGAIQRFGTVQQRVIDGMGVLGVLAGLFLLSWIGFGAALSAYPLLMLGAALVAWPSLRFTTQRASDRRPLRQQISEALAALRGEKNAALRRAAAAYGLSIVLTAWVYFIITPMLGLLASRGGISAVLGTTLGGLLYAMGGFSSTLLVGRLDARRGADASPEQEHQRVRRSTSRWLAASAVTLLGAFTLAMATTPGGLAAGLAFLLLFGMSASGLNIYIEAFIKIEAPETVRGSILGLIRAASLLAAAASFPALGTLFSFFSEASGPAGAPMPTPGGFWALAAGLGVIAVVFARVAAALRRA